MWYNRYMFHVKVCGITNLCDARLVAEAGADAVGLNFYPKSPRCIALQTAEEIVAALPSNVAKVGLFVNAPADDICDIFDRLSLDFIQLHGDEPPEFLPQLGPRPLIRAFRIDASKPDRLQTVMDYLARCRELSAMPAMTLWDAFSKTSYGGTGKVGDWATARKYVEQSRECEREGKNRLPPLILAGGLTADNVAEAILAVQPSAVDTAGGVESSPGRKDAAAVTSFVRAAREAMALSS